MESSHEHVDANIPKRLNRHRARRLECLESSNFFCYQNRNMLLSNDDDRVLGGARIPFRIPLQPRRLAAATWGPGSILFLKS